ncbi:hypothetical protein LXA43DRAFT_1104485 [Ganoderma leucocontextum]|nr:hypothetical protein LXA43DRAFT_1104485 [Ganoderma leucocontextum]
MAPRAVPQLPGTPSVHPLQHRPACEHCEDGRVSVPLLCTGQSDRDHMDWWYELCSNKARPRREDERCSYFQWREDIHKGAPVHHTVIQCPGPVCALEGKQRNINGECFFGLCLQCCRYAKDVVPGLRSCTSGGHRQGKARYEIIGPIQTAEGGALSGPAHAGDPASHSGDAAPHPGDAAPPRDAAPRGGPAGRASGRTSAATRTYRRSCSEYYMGRVDAADAAHRIQAESANVEAQREAQQKKMVMVIWYEQDNEEGEYFQVIAPYYGWFHPKDAPELVERFAVDQKSFQFYDRVLALWVTLSPTSGTRRVIGLDELHYRSLGVRDAPGMPVGRGTKRNAEGTTVPDWAVAGSSTGGSIPAMPQSQSRFLSPAPTLPPETPTSSHAQDMWPTPSWLASTSGREDSSLPVLGVLPALFATSAGVPGSVSAQGSTQAVEPSPPPLSFGPAPRGPSTAGWPLKYVCDMAAGFDLMQTYEDGPDHLKRPVAFAEVFNVEYKKNTVNDNLRFWRAACDAPDVRAQFVNARRTAKGEWKELVKWYKGCWQEASNTQDGQDPRWDTSDLSSLPQDFEDLVEGADSCLAVPVVDVSEGAMEDLGVETKEGEQSDVAEGFDDDDEEGARDGDDERDMGDSDSSSQDGSGGESDRQARSPGGGAGADDGHVGRAPYPSLPRTCLASADDDSDGLPSGSAEPGGRLLWTALRAYGFVDSRYVDSARPSSPSAASWSSEPSINDDVIYAPNPSDAMLEYKQILADAPDPMVRVSVI